MKAEAQRIAIAEVCGASFWMVHIGSYPFFEVRWKARPKGMSAGYLAASHEVPKEALLRMPLNGYIPDYLGDLNACHEMEKHLEFSQDDDYEWILGCLCLGLDPDSDHGEYDRHYIESSAIKATAPQRAEAFLRALKLWIP